MKTPAVPPLFTGRKKIPCSLQRSINRLFNNAEGASQSNGSLRSVHCALGDPFNRLRSARLSAFPALCKCTNCFYLHINGFLTAVFNFYLYYCFSVVTSSSDFNLFCKKSLRILFFYLPTLRKSSRIPS